MANKLIIKKGEIDPRFYNLLHKLYKPMLSKSHMSDKVQYTVYLEGVSYPIAFYQINPYHKFCQIAVIPQMGGKNIAKQMILECAKRSKKDVGSTIGWACEAFNIPSLKLLHSLGGGIWQRPNPEEMTRGTFTLDKTEARVYRARLKEYIDNDKYNEQFDEWYQEYRNRDKEREALNKYLETFDKE